MPGGTASGADALGPALEALSGLAPAARLDAAAGRLRGARAGPLAGFEVACELDPAEGRIDGRLLEAVAARALGGARGAVFTGEAEARILAAFGLAHAAALRGGPDPAEGIAMLLGVAPPSEALSRALAGLAVLDPACGGGALLAAAERLARRAGGRLRLLGIDLSPLAARAAAVRLALLGADAAVMRGEALSRPWPACDLVLANPPFVRHEALSREAKARAVRASGLSAQADLSAHFAAVAIRRSRVAALVWPRALFTSRSAGPLLADARARGGFALALSSRASGSFAASVETSLCVWREGGGDRPWAEASVPLADLSPLDLAGLARGAGSARLRLAPRVQPVAPEGGGSLRVGDVCVVRFGVKSGCNPFFHLLPLGGGRYRSPLAGEVSLAPGDVVPILATLKEARSPEAAVPRRVLFRPARETATARALVALGERLGVHLRPTCSARSPWWRLAPGRGPAPVLYPAKVGARAFAFLNAAGLYEDKKWHALFPRPGAGVEPWLLALVLSSTPVRLAVDLSARQLTGAQAIADVDCRVLAAAPFPEPRTLVPLRRPLHRCREALALDPVTTDLAGMLARPAQRELDLLAGRALGLSPRQVERTRRDLASRVEARLGRAARIREALAAGG